MYWTNCYYCLSLCHSLVRSKHYWALFNPHYWIQSFL